MVHTEGTRLTPPHSTPPHPTPPQGGADVGPAWACNLEPPQTTPGEHPAVTSIYSCPWAPSLFAARCFEHAEPHFVSCQAGSSAHLPREAQVGSPLKSPSQLTALPSGLPPGKPTASGVDERPQSSHLPRKHTARLSPARSHCTPLPGAGTMALCKPTWAFDEEGEPGERGVPSQPGARPPLTRADPGGGSSVPAAPSRPGTRGRTAGVRDFKLGPLPSQPRGPSPSGNLSLGLNRGWLRSWDQPGPPGWGGHGQARPASGGRGEEEPGFEISGP